MEIERRIFRSASILVGASIASQLANFAFVIYLARSFGPTVFGVYVFALALGAILEQFVNLGTNQLLLRQLSQDAERWSSSVGLVFPVQVFLAIVTWVSVVLVFALFGADATELRIILTVVAFQLMTPIWVIFSLGYTAAERMEYFALSDVGVRVLIMSIGSVAIWSGCDIETVLKILPVSGLIAALVLGKLSALEFGRPQFRIEFSALFRLWREALPFFGIAMLSLVYLKAGLLLLKASGGAEQVGLFASGERLVMAAGILYVTFGNAIFPALVKLVYGDRKRFHLLADRCGRLMLLVSLPLASVMYIFSDEIIDLLFGAQYLEAAAVLRIVAWLVAFRGITVVLESISIASNHKNLVLIAKFVGVICLFVACLGLLPTMGAIGLAIAVVVAQGSVLASIYIGLRPTGYLPSILKPTMPILAACAITVLIASISAGSDLWIRIAIVSATGTLLLWLLGAIRISDLEFARQLLSPSSARDDH